jgi:hypothetical protein
MKKLLLSLLVCYTLAAQAQNNCIPCELDPQCPPTVWCHPTGDGMSFMDGATAAADYLGRIFSADPCANANYAEQVYCYPAKLLKELSPCFYGENTPQYTLCESGGSGGGNGEGTPANPGGGGTAPTPDSSSSKSFTTPAMQAKLNAASKGIYKINSKVRPVYIQSENRNKALKEGLARYKRGETIHTWKNNFTIKLAYKYSKEGSTDFYAQFVMYDNKGKVIGYPMLMGKGKRTYLFDMVY